MPEIAVLHKVDGGGVTLRYQIDTKVFYWEFASVTELLQFLHDLAKISEGDTRQLRPAAVGFITKFFRRSPQFMLDLSREIAAFIKVNYPEYAWCKQLAQDVYLAAKGADRE